MPTPNTPRNSQSLRYLCDYINKEYLESFNSFDKHITRNLREAGIETRSVSSNGLWCCALLPTSLIIYLSLHQVSPVYTVVTFISLGLLFYCLLFLIFLSVSCLVLQEQVYGGCVASSLISALLLFMFQGKDLTHSLLFTLPTVFLFSTLLRISITKFPKTFTIGEAMMVVQSVVLYAAMTAGNFLEGAKSKEMALITTTVNTVLSTVGIIVTALNLMTNEQKNLESLGYVAAASGFFGITMLYSLVGARGIVTILNYVLFDIKRAQLISFWLAAVAISIGVLMCRTQLAVKASTVTRKAFHILASTVFLSGIVYDQDLMILASGIGLGLLILVEALRKSGIEPISSTLESVFIVYSDEKDSGFFAMTPFYLYCGLACPLLLVPSHPGDQLELLSGVLSIGVGDTAASWFGSRYGFNKWAGSSKSMEGTTFNILCQILTVYALQLFDLIDANNALIRTAIAATISGLAEAWTEQVDNLVLPVISLIAFQITWFLS